MTVGVTVVAEITVDGVGELESVIIPLLIGNPVGSDVKKMALFDVLAKDAGVDIGWWVPLPRGGSGMMVVIGFDSEDLSVQYCGHCFDA